MPPLGNKVYIEFSHFDLEYILADEGDYFEHDVVEHGCAFDFVTIEETDGEGSILKSQKYCSNPPKALETNRIVVIK